MSNFNSGKISREEFLGFKIFANNNAEICDTILSQFDTNSDGFIDIDEFVNYNFEIISRLKALNIIKDSSEILDSLLEEVTAAG